MSRPATKMGSIIKDLSYLSSLLNPIFTQCDEMVFFSAHFSYENYEKHWKDKAKKDPKKVERTINHIHLDEISDEISTQKRVAEQVMSVWRNTLLKSFPERIFSLFIAQDAQGNYFLELCSERIKQGA